MNKNLYSRIINSITRKEIMKRHIILFVFVMLLISGCTTQEPPQLEELVSEEGGFSIMLPGKPKFETKTINTEAGYLTTNIYVVEANGVAYAVMYTDYPEEAIANLTAEQILDNARDGSVANSFGTLVKEEIISINGNPGRYITIAVKGGGIRQRGYLVNNRIYSIAIATSSDKMFIKTISKVLESFKLSNYNTSIEKSESGFKEYKNTDIAIKSIIYPEDWSFEVSEDRAVASFSSPDRIAGFDIGVYIYDKIINLETFHSQLLQMFPEDPDVEFTILDEEIKVINTHKWLISNRIVKINDVSIYQRFGLILTGYYDNQQTIQIVMETDEEHFEEYKLLFDKIVESIRFTI